MLKDSLSSVSILTGLSLLLVALMLFGASQGALNISFSALFNDEYRDIWLNIRLPRVLLAVLVGAALVRQGSLCRAFSQSNGRSRPAWREQRLRADGRHSR